MECRIEKNGTSVTITDVATGIGLCFTEGGSMQRYTASLYVPDTAILSTEEGVVLSVRYRKVWRHTPPKGSRKSSLK